MACIKLYVSYKKNYGSSNNTEFNRNEKLVLTKHARCRMDCRHITENEIEEIVHDGKINDDKSETSQSHSSKYALEGYTKLNQHLRIVVTPENDGLVVITCIDLDKEWTCPSCN